MRRSGLRCFPAALLWNPGCNAPPHTISAPSSCHLGHNLEMTTGRALVSQPVNQLPVLDVEGETSNAGLGPPLKRIIGTKGSRMQRPQQIMMP